MSRHTKRFTQHVLAPVLIGAHMWLGPACFLTDAAGIAPGGSLSGVAVGEKLEEVVSHNFFLAGYAYCNQFYTSDTNCLSDRMRVFLEGGFLAGYLTRAGVDENAFYTIDSVNDCLAAVGPVVYAVSFRFLEERKACNVNGCFPASATDVRAASGPAALFADRFCELKKTGNLFSAYRLQLESPGR